MKNLTTMMGLILLTALYTTPAQAKDYVVKRGDTLASIARANYGEPVFGPNGTIKKIFKLNPWANSKTVLEPEQVVVLEDTGKAAPTRQAAPRIRVSAPPAPAPEVQAHIPTPLPPEPSQEEESSEAPIPPPPVVPEQVANPQKTQHEEVLPEQKPAPPPPSHNASVEDEHAPKNYYSIIPNYSMIHQSATESATGISYSIDSSSAYGAELGWDHWWNNSFSTVLTYALLQMSSNEKNQVTSSPVVDNLSLSRFELTLFNRIGHSARAGLGIAYADHVFLERFSDEPKSPQLYKTAFMNPFVALEATLHETHRFEVTGSAKISALPAQVGQGHDLRSGTEYFAQLALIQKAERYNILYGVSYSTEDQTRTDASETRTEWALRVGILF